MQKLGLIWATLLFAGSVSPLAAQTQDVRFGNLHSHTSYSDGTGTPAEVTAHARLVVVRPLTLTLSRRERG